MPFSRPTIAFAAAVAIGCALPAVFAGAAAPRKRVPLDTSFGDGGVATFPGLGSPRLEEFSCAAVGDAGGLRLYVAGDVPAPAVARFDLDGLPDETFGDGGVAQVPLTGTVSRVSAAGGLVVFGSFGAPEGSGIVGSVGAARLLSDGSGLDATFGTDGVLPLNSAVGAQPAGVTHVDVDRRDGSYVAVVKHTRVAAEPQFGLIRFSRDGVIDSAFGGDGYVEFDLPDVPTADVMVMDMAVDSTGRVVVAFPRATVRFLADGTRDLMFGYTGLLADAVGEPLFVWRLEIDASDRIVAYGSSIRARSVGVYRFTADTLPDTTLSRAGRVPVRYRGRGRETRADVLTLVNAGDVLDRAPGDRAFLAGGVTFRPRARGGDYRDGWFGRLVGETRSLSASEYVYRNPLPRSEEQEFPADAVAVPGGVILVGTTRVLTTDGASGIPFLAKFAIEP